MNNHDPHIRTLLERWISGDINATDEAALRDAARQDAFLRDALNGYARHPDADHAAALDRMRRRTAAAPARHWLPWMGVAATLLCLVVAAWWISLPKDGPAESLAATDTAAPTTETVQLAPEQTTEPAAPLADAAPTRERQPGAVAPARRAAPSVSAAPPARPDESTADDTDKPFAATTIRETEAPAGIATESAYPAPATAPAGSAPTTDKQARAKDAYAQAESRKQAPSPSRAASALQADNALQNAYPNNGLDAFNSYVTRNSPPRSKGEWVTLRFDLDATGQPIRIEVLDASRKTLNAKAIELLRDGGPWQLVPGAPTQGIVYRMVF